MASLNDPLLLRDFAKALEDAGIVEDSAEVIRRPYKFEAYFDTWAENEYPQQEDAEWDSFVEALNSENEEDDS